VERKFKFCAQCRRTLTDAELARGLYVTTDDGMLCANCAQRLDETLPDSSPTDEVSASASPGIDPTPAALPPDITGDLSERLEKIGEQAEAIHRILLFEKTSTWNVVAGVAQCLAAGMLLISALQWFDGGSRVLNALILTLVFQVMALTFFLKAK